ncbi:MAG TPA: filamentous hemagglutinin N-terminal domain-containing protein, partial [Bacteroidia bacterium]|nr:filamentous hemagglutinin N-terminal domain-containing protein [Bacteroidia bacterium]
MGTANLDINNLSQRAIINWQSFSIQSGEVTSIHQAADAFTLNRVVSGNPTAIYGQLKAAQGGVAVINPSGIVVHQGGSVDVAGMLTLSTLDVSNENFLNGGAMRFKGTTSAGVRNYGAVSSSSGDVVLLGNFLQNAGTVSAPRGVVAFGAGGDIVVDQVAGAKISVLAGGSGGNVGIDNSGEIHAAAAELKAHGNVYALAIKNDGLVRASGYNFTGGRLTLSAGSQGSIVNTGQLHARNSDGSGGQINVSGGRVQIGGSVDASGAVGRAGGSVTVGGADVEVAAGAVVNTGGATAGTISIDAADTAVVGGQLRSVGETGLGGRVTVEGTHVAVGGGAEVNVSGATGGGLVQIGGGFQGRDESVRNAETLVVEEGALIIADAVEGGNGGTVILWSDGDTLFEGDLSARGVSKGGFAEISGKRTLAVSGNVDLLATQGAAGTLLLDPTNVLISALGGGVGSAWDGTSSNISNRWLSEQLDRGNNVIISTNFGGIEPGHITIGRTTSTADA